MNQEIELMPDGTHVLVNGKEYELPESITTVKGVPVEMLLLKLKGHTYAEAFRTGVRLLLGNIESEQDILKKQISELEKSISADRFQLSLLKDKYGELEGQSNADAQELADKVDHIVAEFEKLNKSVGFKKDPSKRAYLAGLDAKLSEDDVAQIYKDATPAGSVMPSVENLRAQIEKYLM